MICLVPVLISSCATYHPKPLPTKPDLASMSALTVPVSKLDLPGLKPHPFNPANGFDETTVITLAVLNNPDLKAARLQAGVAEAQLLEAGLLPDPVVNGGLSQSSVRTGYSIGLSEDLQALILRDAAKAAARAHERDVNLQILWQEWQVAEKARELFIQTEADARLRRILTANRDLLAERYRQDQAAFERHDATAAAVTADSAALNDADAQLRRLETQINDTSHALNQLLGLQPETKLRFTGSAEFRALSRREFQSAVAALPRRRADLQALQAGYQSQEETLREAVLAQFPAMSAGVQQGKSAEEGVHTIGFTVNVTLPIFNRNRGQIAIQRATHAVLFQTYQARLDQAVSEADQLWQAAQIMARQLQDLQARLPSEEKIAAAAKRSFQRGNLDAATYVGLELNFQAEQAEAIRLRASLDQAQAALETLLGLPFESREINLE